MAAVALALMAGLAVLAVAVGGTTVPIELFLVGPLLVAARGTDATASSTRGSRMAEPSVRSSRSREPIVVILTLRPEAGN